MGAFPSLILSPKGRRACPQLRASNEHILIVRVARARRAGRRPSDLIASEAWARQPCASATSFTSRAQRKPIQFILMLGSVPMRCAYRTLGAVNLASASEGPLHSLLGPWGFSFDAVAYASRERGESGASREILP
jgi:hypothetical protein